VRLREVPVKRQVVSYCQSQPVGERRQRMGRQWGQVGEVHHALTMRRLPIAVKLTVAHPTRQMSVSLSDRLKNLADRFGPPQALRQRGQADRELPLTCQAARYSGTSSSRRQITP
jgi:hypothetical protein